MHAQSNTIGGRRIVRIVAVAAIVVAQVLELCIPPH